MKLVIHGGLRQGFVVSLLGCLIGCAGDQPRESETPAEPMATEQPATGAPPGEAPASNALPAKAADLELAARVSLWNLDQGRRFITCKYVIRNVSPGEIRLSRPLAWTVTLETPDGDALDATPPDFPGLERPVRIGAGESIQGNIFDLKEYFPLDKPGTYRLRIAITMGDDRPLASDWTTFDLVTSAPNR
jgi:hypothetical protein